MIAISLVVFLLGVLIAVSGAAVDGPKWIALLAVMMLAGSVTTMLIPAVIWLWNNAP